MIRFPKDPKMVTNAVKSQWAGLQEMRSAANADVVKYLAAVNAGLSPAEAYREMDERSAIILNPAGEFASLQRASAVSKSVDLGRTVLDYRQASKQVNGQTSMSGQKGVLGDKISYSYAGSPIPIHDHGVSVEWRNGLTFGAEGFDWLVDALREAELSTFRAANRYFWDGDANIQVKDRSWLGFKADPSVLQTTTALDFLDPATTAKQAVDEIDRLKNLLRIDNNCVEELSLGVSREVLSVWQRTPYSANETGWGTVKTFIEGLVGIKEVYEEPELVGGQQFAFTFFDQLGFHAITGMAMSTYAKQRLQHNDDWQYIKWMAQGFQSRNSFSGQKCAMYVQAA